MSMVEEETRALDSSDPKMAAIAFRVAASKYLNLNDDLASIRCMKLALMALSKNKEWFKMARLFLEWLPVMERFFGKGSKEYMSWSSNIVASFLKSGKYEEAQMASEIECSAAFEFYGKKSVEYGKAQMRRGDALKDPLKCYLLAAKIFTNLNDAFNIVQCYHRLARFYLTNSDFNSALSAIGIALAANDGHSKFVSQTAAIIYARLKRFDLSVSFMKQAIVDNDGERQFLLSKYQRALHDNDFAVAVSSEYRMCAECTKAFHFNTNSMCGGCRRVHYCGTECQMKHWLAGHRENCK